MPEYKFKLTRPAKSQGGDRYEHGAKGDKDYMVFYIPQSISRGSENDPWKSLTIQLKKE